MSQQTTLSPPQQDNHKDTWSVITVASSLIFDNIEIGKCIYTTFKNKNWIDREFILNNLIQHKKNNIISVIYTNINKNTKLNQKWEEKKHSNILYQLLLTIYKDNKINISNILNDYIAIIPPHHTENTIVNLSHCTVTQIIQVLIHQTLNYLSTEIHSKFHNKIIEYFVNNEINGSKLQSICDEKHNESMHIQKLTTFVNNQFIDSESKYDATFKEKLFDYLYNNIPINNNKNKLKRLHRYIEENEYDSDCILYDCMNINTKHCNILLVMESDIEYMYYIEQFIQLHPILPFGYNMCVKLFKTIISYERIWKCIVCGYTNIIIEQKKNCDCCHSFFKPHDIDKQEHKYNNQKDEDELFEEDVLSNRILQFFDEQSGKPFDNEVFPKLIKLVGKDKHGLFAIKYDNYSIDLYDKKYDTVLTSFIAWILLNVKCENIYCGDISKLVCQCNKNAFNFQRYTYYVILSIIGLKLANNDSLLSLLSEKKGTITEIADIFINFIPDKLKPENKVNKEHYFHTYKQYIIEWISFEFYNFKCIECRHINKTILIDRMFEYAMNLNHCRLCHHRRLATDTNGFDLNVFPTKKIQNAPFKFQQYQTNKSEEYKCGVPVRYTVLKPKYCSLAEEILLNDIAAMKKQLFDEYLTRAIKGYEDSQNYTESAVFTVSENKDFGISPYESIGVCHLLVILIYTENIGFARNFGWCYWGSDDINLFVNNFYWFGRSLYEAVYFMDRDLIIIDLQ